MTYFRYNTKNSLYFGTILKINCTVSCTVNTHFHVFSLIRYCHVLYGISTMMHSDENDQPVCSDVHFNESLLLVGFASGMIRCFRLSDQATGLEFELPMVRLKNLKKVQGLIKNYLILAKINPKIHISALFKRFLSQTQNKPS